MNAQDSRALVADVLGFPYAIGANGPDAFDCWGLVRFAYREHFGVSLPEYATHRETKTKTVASKIQEVEALGEWQSVDEPQAGDLVALSRGKVFHHVGLWVDVDGGRCLHALEGATVVAHSLQQLRRDHFTRIQFFRHGQKLHN